MIGYSKALIDNKIERFFLASSVAIYGESISTPSKETSEIKPSSRHAQIKENQERILE